MSDAPAVSATSYEPLPELYARWLGDLLGGGIPRETRATCGDCAMCAKGAPPPDLRATFFDPAVKCCTYVPELPNYLVGRILNDATPGGAAGRAALELRLDERVAVTPLGVGKAPVYARLYDDISDSFGRSPAMTCPYFIKDGGGCGVWRHRNAICTTWFCKHVRGKTARTFWRQSLQPMLEELEADLKVWCALQLGLGDTALRDVTDSAAWSGRRDTLTPQALDNKVEPVAYAKLWGAWAGREAEYFRRAADLVDALSWPEALAIAGPRVHALAQLTRDAFASLTSDTLPPRLEAGPMNIIRAGPQTTRVATYSPFDPIDVPNLVLALLHVFDGRPTEAAIADIEAQTGVRLERSLVLKLVDFGLLEEPPERAAPSSTAIDPFP